MKYSLKYRLFFTCSFFLSLLAVMTYGLAFSAESGHSSPVLEQEVAQNVNTLIKERACPSCYLAGADFTRMDLQGVNLAGANLSGARFFLASLTNADLRNANLEKTMFGGADLAGADLRGAHLREAMLEGAYITGALFDDEIDTSDDMQLASSAKPPRQTPQQAKEGSKKLGSQELKNAEDTEDVPVLYAGKEKIAVAPVAIAELMEEISAEKKEAQPEEDARGQRGQDSAQILPSVAPVSPQPPSGQELVPLMETGVATGMLYTVETPEEAKAKKEAKREQVLESRTCIECDLGGFDFSDQDLEGADLERVDLSNANLQETDLGGANLKAANLQGANLQEADLREADLYMANLEGADLRGADLEGTLLDSATLTGALGLEKHAPIIPE